MNKQSKRPRTTQYQHTADLDLRLGSGVRISLWALPSPTTVCKHHAHPQPVVVLYIKHDNQPGISLTSPSSCSQGNQVNYAPNHIQPSVHENQQTCKIFPTLRTLISSSFSWLTPCTIGNLAHLSNMPSACWRHHFKSLCWTVPLFLDCISSIGLLSCYHIFFKCLCYCFLSKEGVRKCFSKHYSIIQIVLFPAKPRLFFTQHW